MKSDKRPKGIAKPSASRKRRVTEFKKVVNLLKINTEEGFAHMDRQLLLVAFNDQFEKQLFKFSKHRLSKGKSIVKYFGAERVSHVQNMCQSALGGEETVDEIEVSALGQPNQILSVKYKPAYDEQENINGVFISLKDITETKAAKRQLEVVHHRLLFHLENSPLGYIEWDDELHVKAWSKRSEEIFGWSEEEFIRMRNDGYSQVYKDDVEWVSKIARQLISGDVERNSVQHRNYTKDGNVIWCEWFNSILRDKNGKVITIMSLVQDITRRKEAEQHRIQHERRFKSLIENSSDIIIILNYEGKAQYVSPSIEKVLGYTADQMMRRQLSSILHADERNGFEKILEALLKGSQIPVVGAELRALHQDGSLRWLEPTYTNLRHDPAIGDIVINFRDITERKASQEKNTLQAILLESVGQAVVATDVKGNVLYWNYAAEKMYGWSSEETIGKHMDDLIPNHLTDQETFAITRDLFNGKVWTGEFVVQRKDGTDFSSSVTKSTIYDWDGRFAGIVTVFSDISERRKNEEKIKKSISSIRAIFDSAIEGFVLTDRNFTISHFNAIAKETIMLNLGEKEPQVGDNILDYIDDSRKHQYKELIKKVLKGDIVQYDRYYSRRDGKTYWFQFSLSPVWIDSEITGVCIAANDITNRKIAEQKLEFNEKRYRALVENGLDAVAILSEDGKAVYFSPSIKKVLGYTEQEIMQMDLFALLHPSEVNMVQKIAARVFVHRGIPVGEYSIRLRHKDGSWHWYELTSTNLLHDPSISGIVINFRDVTEKKIAKEKHEFDNNNLNAIINTTNDLMWSLDNNYKLITCNKAFEEMINQMTGESITEGQDILSTAFSPDLLRIYKKFYERAFAGETFTEEVHTEQFEIWSEISFYPIRQGNLVIGTACYSRNITEKKKAEQKIIESEERYRQIVETAQEGIWMVDEEFKIILVNGKLCEILQYSKDELLGRPTSDFMDEEGKKFWLSTREKRMQGICDSGDSIKYITGSGEQIWTSVSSTPIFDRAGKFKGGLGMLTDITKRKSAELKTQELIGRLQSKNQNLQQFAYIVSHNLRAPIAKIQGLISLIDQQQYANSDKLNLFESVADEVANLDTIVTDINSIITAQDSKNVIQEYILFESELRHVEEALKNEIADSKASIAVDFSGLTGMITVKDYFNNILLNLISNSIKYRRHGLPLEIYIQFTQDQKFICLAVRDNGMGIDLTKNEENVFGLYKRFHGESIPGRGVGLNLVKSQAESLGGRVVVESKPDEGSTFRIFFPRLDVVKREIKNIFLIDDDRLSSSINLRIIKNSRINVGVNAFTNAKEALDTLHNLKATSMDEFPDLIFLDINMPVMDGWEFLEEFEKLGGPALEKCRICMLSSSIDPSDIAKSRRYNSVYKFISKPLTPEQLAEFFITTCDDENLS